MNTDLLSIMKTLPEQFAAISFKPRQRRWAKPVLVRSGIRKPRFRGFTLIELLVTFAVLSIMFFLINQLFNDTVRAVTLGAQNIDITDTVQAINNQMQADAAAMVPPDPTSGAWGFLIIVNQRVQDVNMPEPGGSSATVDEELRSDQLYFIRSADTAGSELRPLSPATTSGYTSSSTLDSAFARVYYGHVDRTAADGTINGTLAGTTDAARGINQNGWNWLLGRQALLLPNSESGSPMHIDGALPTSGFSMSSGTSPNQMYMGLHDVSDRRLYHTSPTNTHQSIFAPVTPGSNSHIELDLTTTVATTVNDLQDLTFKDERLKANPFPGDNRAYELWQIAQMHPVLAEGVSEFIVQFAGDYEGSGGADGVGDDELDRDGSGNIKWYDYTNTTSSSTPNLYGAYQYPGSSVVEESTNFTNADHMYVFGPNDAANWPWLLRIRYRIHDQRGRLTSFSQAANAGAGDTITGRWVEVILPVKRQ